MSDTLASRLQGAKSGLVDRLLYGRGVDRELRRRADALIARHGWGQSSGH